LDTQGAANATLLVEDHRRPVLPAVSLLDLGEEPLALELIDVDHVDDAFRTDVGAGPTEDAAERVEPDVEVAHETAGRFGDGLVRVVAELDRGREIDLRFGRGHPRRE